MSSINLREILLGRPTRLRYITRFSICPRTHDESVAEHSYYTAYIAMMLGLALQADGITVNMGLVLTRALMHDVDESYSGDFIRMFKHSSLSLKLAIDNANSGFVQKFCHDTGPGLPTLPEAWAFAKDATVEGAIVSLADFMSVVSYIIQEIKAGNHNMFEHLDDLRHFYDTFPKKAEKYAVLQNYIAQCGSLLNEIEVRKAEFQ